jgi:hypothetical protein
MSSLCADAGSIRFLFVWDYLLEVFLYQQHGSSNNEEIRDKEVRLIGDGRDSARHHVVSRCAEYCD